jgi:hypothetical protein
MNIYIPVYLDKKGYALHLKKNGRSQKIGGKFPSVFSSYEEKKMHKANQLL